MLNLNVYRSDDCFEENLIPFLAEKASVQYVTRDTCEPLWYAKWPLLLYGVSASCPILKVFIFNGCVFVARVTRPHVSKNSFVMGRWFLLYNGVRNARSKKNAA